jgi:hypothetical protein
MYMGEGGEGGQTFQRFQDMYHHVYTQNELTFQLYRFGMRNV